MAKRKKDNEEDGSEEDSFDLAASSQSSLSLSGSDSESEKKAGKSKKIAAVVHQEKKNPQKDVPKTANTKSSSTKGSSVDNAIKKESSNTAKSTIISAATTSQDLLTGGGPVTTELAAKKLLLQYLKSQNRPYSAIQLHDNLHGRIPKSVLERSLASLTSTEGAEIVCKEYGKSKIYFVDQNIGVSSDFTAEELEQLEEENEGLKQTLAKLSGDEKQLHLQLQELEAQPSDADLPRLLASLEATLQEKRGRLATLSGQAATQDPRGLETVIRVHNFHRTALLARKLQCMEAVEALSEGLGRKTKDLMAELCLDSDQDAGW
eukprot:CAMPEP_0170076678 /NCGR_PEP_ID=MMETSP0019_2-20121128/13640_1 /TAXON_ID=98059 /ORGANISM="Dinobryon sp., Strain UTEXLB2267" /LENGTH=319 /DNA_ID=CAMNT_0010288537 /DNA_START=43 /DNA_END=999 /DNA_ORIENTATION=+